MYKISKIYNTNLQYSDNFLSYQRRLIEEGKLFNNMPIKMNTLHDKARKITNFIECIDTYNGFIDSSNEFPVVSKSDIYKRIENEDKIYIKSFFIPHGYEGCCCVYSMSRRKSV